MDPIFQEESARLSWTKEQYLQAAEDERLMLSALPRLYPNDPNLLNELLLHTHNRIVRLEQSRRKPYFARIDFTDGSSAQTDRCYIGKIGVADQDGQIITVDWRAPVATLYYDSNLGKASYQAPEGAICGTLSLKRQYEIEEGTLLSYHDVDSVSNDELLKPFLSAGADSRLKNIVASIQTEQNRIIREDLHKNLIVQGAAGSGKTTVALHRIAYLVYRWRDSIRPSQYMVIGPNLFFISYISAVLPDLDVDNVPQFTYATLAAQYLGENFTVQNPAETLAAVVEQGMDTAMQLGRQTLAMLRKKTVTQEDLPALIYLKTQIFGTGDYARYRHAVVDEAQDLGEFAFFSLQKLLSGSTFTVVGDLAQSIYGFHGVESWHSVQQRSFPKGAEICYMEKSYRTTVEIMEAANLLTKSLGLPAAQPVIRHGEPVRLHPMPDNPARAVADCIREYQALGFGSVAILGKTAAETARIYTALAAMDISIQLIDDEADAYSGGICAMTGHLSKGLEFDGVILLDAGEAVYRSDQRLDLHLLYVAMTRPLHRLDVFYSGEVCAPLAGLLE